MFCRAFSRTGITSDLFFDLASLSSAKARAGICSQSVPITSRRPLRQAMWRAVLPALSSHWRSGPRERSPLRHPTDPLAQHSIRGVQPVLTSTTVLISVVFSSSCCTKRLTSSVLIACTMRSFVLSIFGSSPGGLIFRTVF